MNLERWTYNKRTGICEYFKYGGCGASGNIFEDWVECEILCVPPSEYKHVGFGRTKSRNVVFSPII